MDDSFSIFSRLRTVRDADLSAAIDAKGVSMWSAKGVLYTLTTFADAEGVAYPTIATIARSMGAARTTVYKALDALVEAGILSRFQGKEDVTWGVWVVDYERLGALGSAASRDTPRRAARHPVSPGATPRATWRDTNSTDKEPEKKPHNTPPNGEAAQPVAAVDASPSRGEEALVAIGVDRRVARALTHEHGDARCTRVARTVRAKLDAGHTVRSPAGFAVDCLRKGWEPEEDAKTREAMKEQQGHDALARTRAMPPERVREAWRAYAAHASRGNEVGRRHLLTLDPTQHGNAARLLVEAMDAGEV